MKKIRLMAVLNCTPDSFYDGSDMGLKAWVEKGLSLVAEGADVLDIGGESSRPGAKPVDAAEEKKRVIPLLKALRLKSNIPISVDTQKAEVARAAIGEGAEMINDISAGGDPEMFDLIAQKQVFYVAMHMQGQPKTMQNSPHYGDPVAEIVEFLFKKSQLLQEKGLNSDKIIWDPGIGFGKTLEHNKKILESLQIFNRNGHELLLGLSRKSFIPQICESSIEAEERLPGTLAAMVYSIKNGVHFFRVHDVAASRQFIDVWQTLNKGD